MVTVTAFLRRRPRRSGPGEGPILKHLFRNLKGVTFDLKQKNHATISKALKAHKSALLRNMEIDEIRRRRCPPQGERHFLHPFCCCLDKKDGVWRDVTRRFWF